MIAKTSRPEQDVYAGFHKRFRKGHHLRGRLGSNANAFRSGKRFYQSGYVGVCAPDHHSADADGYVLEHRFVYEQTRQVTLPKTVVIHHINGVRDDNRPENLIASTRQKHALIHIRAGQVVSLFLDDKLLAAARAHVRATGVLPDLEELSAQVHADTA